MPETDKEKAEKLAAAKKRVGSQNHPSAAYCFLHTLSTRNDGSLPASDANVT
jgi:hypothetical protein